ncbi:MAG TPA: carbamoyltransferase [Candidatus Limnocylindrales bacterium]|nr:carbamoyltransferase [Candidatus Limnocylindrales bacterium]
MDILGVSCYYHDAAAALLRDGRLVAAAQEERFSRVKHDYGFPRNAIRFCLDEAGIRGSELDYAVFYEKPHRKLSRIAASVLQTYPHSRKVFHEVVTNWLMNKFWVARTLAAELGIHKDKILFCEHHMSHAASAFLCSPFEEAAILTVDGVGEWVTATIGTGRKNEILLTKEMRFPHSVGLLYSAFTSFLGFEIGEGEYKVMGMAAYGEPSYVDEVRELIDPNEDGSATLDMNYFCYHYSTEGMFNERVLALLGAPRPRDMLFYTKATGFPKYFGERPANFEEGARLNQHYADVACSVQQVTEELLLGMARQAHEETGLKKLCMAGGVALNSVANNRILRETPFEELYIQPAAGDDGGALGAALWAYNTVLGKPRSFQMEHAFWGRGYSRDEIGAFVAKNNISHRRIDDEEQLLAWVVERLTQGKVVGWFQGRFEWGPRALGGRSILADARNPAMKDIVNTKIKFREAFRPFAPSVLAKHAETYFDLPDAARHFPARFMLYVAPVKKKQQATLPAVTHVDGTGRLQTVFREQNARYYRLIEKFGEATGVPVVLNTSFNLKGEPIVNTPENAFSTFSRSEMDCLVLGDFVVEK